MNELQNQPICEQRQTLDSSLSILKNRASELKGLANFAERTVAKMNRLESLNMLIE